MKEIKLRLKKQQQLNTLQQGLFKKKIKKNQSVLPAV